MNDTLIKNLPLVRYRLDFIVETKLYLPDYAGSTLRGAFGSALRRLTCMTRQSTCDNCPLLHSCPYAQVFETRPSKEHVLQKFSHVPHPYVIEPPQWGARIYAAKERLSFHLVLVGRALEYLTLIFLAFDKALARGVGKGDGTARLEKVVQVGARNDAKETVVLSSAEAKITAHDTHLPPRPDMDDQRLVLRFDSPLRLQKNGRPLGGVDGCDLTARNLLMALARRVVLICEFHGSGAPALDFAALARQAEAITSKKNLRWQDWARYSSRQQQKMALGGVVGEWVLSGELAPFLSFLYLGEWLHVGKEATFGLGGYQIQASGVPRVILPSEQ